MQDEIIKLRATESGQIIDVVVLNKSVDKISVVVGEGVHSVKCELLPTANELAYAGNVMGRETVYERSRQQVQADIDQARPSTRRR